MTDQTNTNDQNVVNQDPVVTEEKTSTEDKPKEKTNKDYIIERKDEQIRKLKDKLEKNGIQEEQAPLSEDKLADILFERQERELNVTQFMDKYPALAEKKLDIMKEAMKPSSKGLSVEEIAVKVVGFDGIAKIGSQMKADAEQEAKNNSTMPGMNVNSNKVATEQKTGEYYNDNLPPLFKK